MSEKRTTDSDVVSGVRQTPRIVVPPSNPAVVHPRESLVQPLGDGDLQSIDIRQWDEVSAVPLPCGVALIVARRGGDLRIGTASAGPRVSCTPADVAALTDRLDKQAAQMAGLALDLRKVAQLVDEQGERITDNVRALIDLDDDIDALNVQLADVASREGMGLGTDRVNASISNGANEGSSTACDDQVRPEVRPEGRED